MIHRFYKWYLHNRTRMRIENFINRSVSMVVNNKFSNWLKELFEIGFDYPLYMYNDSEAQYVSKIYDGILVTGEKHTDVTVTPSPSFAMDFRKYNRVARWFLLKKVNKVISSVSGNEELVFRFKSVATYEQKTS